MLFSVEAYQKRVRSAQWKNMRADLIRVRGDRCEHCNLRMPLELHHKTYEHLGQEQFADLELLCKSCHRQADRVRALRASQKANNKAIHTYGRKKYGEDYENIIGDQELWDEVQEWLIDK